MSRQSALGFLEAVEADSSMETRLANVDPTAQAWVAFAKDAGYEFGSDDLRCVSETLTAKELTEANCVEGIIHFRRGGLSDEDLAKVAGGLNATTPSLVSLRGTGPLLGKGLAQRWHDPSDRSGTGLS